MRPKIMGKQKFYLKQLFSFTRLKKLNQTKDNTNNFEDCEVLTKVSSSSILALSTNTALGNY